MPKRFWIIRYGALLWKRDIMAFVPTRPALGGEPHQEDMGYVWFMDESEVNAQVAELRSLGCKGVECVCYEKESECPPLTPP